MTGTDKWIEELFSAPENIRIYERERVVVDATNEVCRVMEDQGVSRTELANKMKVTPANISQLLSGERNMTLGTLSDMFVALDYSLLIDCQPLKSKGKPKREWDTVAVPPQRRGICNADNYSLAS